MKSSTATGVAPRLSRTLRSSTSSTGPFQESLPAGVRDVRTKSNKALRSEALSLEEKKEVSRGLAQMHVVHPPHPLTQCREHQPAPSLLSPLL